MRRGAGMVFAKKLPRGWMDAIADCDDEAEAAFNLQGTPRMSDAEIKRTAEDWEDQADAATIEEMERAEKEVAEAKGQL